MKALNSDLYRRIRSAGIHIPLAEGAKFVFEGREYTVKYVPKTAYNHR